MRLNGGLRVSATLVVIAGGCAAMACGSAGGTLLELQPCATAPAGASATAATTGQVTSYFQLVRRANDQLVAKLVAFRAEYPDGKFYRSSTFREDFAGYAGAAMCALADLERATPPGNVAAAALERDAQIKAVVVDYRAVLEYGLEAVRTRNTSDYRKFNTRVDAVASRMATALALPTR